MTASESGYREIEVRGRPREIGRQIGEAARDLIEAGMAYYEAHHEAMTGVGFATASARGQAYLAHARRWIPSVVEELEGLAEGSGTDVRRLLVPNCGEEFAGAGVTGHCTSLAISDNRRRLLGHNEDWFAGDVRNNVLLRMTLADGARLVAMTSACLLACGGINSHGLATSGNTVSCTDGRVGVPNNFIRRWMLEAQSIEDARARALLAARARGSNHVIVDRHGRICDVETSATAAAIFDARPCFVHTNHFLHVELQEQEDGSGLDGSRRRYERVTELLERGLERGEDLMSLTERILADHANGPSSVCAHPDESVPEGARECTTSSVIWDLEDLSASVCAGPPCRGVRRRVCVE